MRLHLFRFLVLKKKRRHSKKIIEKIFLEKIFQISLSNIFEFGKAAGSELEKNYQLLPL